MNRLIKIIIALLFISLPAFIIRTLYFKNAGISVDEVINWCWHKYHSECLFSTNNEESMQV